MRSVRPTLTLVVATAVLSVSFGAAAETSVEASATAPKAIAHAATADRSAARPAVVDIKTYSGRWMVPSVEWSVTTVARRSAASLSTSWRLRPVAPGSSTYKIVTVATTDGVPACVTAVNETVALHDCKAGMRNQRFRVGRGDFDNQVTFTGRRGTLNTDPDGSLYLGNADEPSAVFTLRNPRRAP